MAFQKLKFNLLTKTKTLNYPKAFLLLSVRFPAKGTRVLVLNKKPFMKICNIL